MNYNQGNGRQFVGQGFPALPPQLANLTPQQLQQLKNQPQFQTMMRNYLQRQQQLQQQNMRPMAPQVPQQVPVQQFQPAAQTPVPTTVPGVVPGVVPGASPPLNVASAPGPVPPRGPGQYPPNPRLGYFRQAPDPRGSLGGPNVPPVADSKVMSRTDSALGSGPTGIPPAISSAAQAVMNRIPYRELNTLHEWSKKLEEEGKEVPVDIKIYENLIEKDDKFLKNYTTQLASRKRTMDRLMGDIKAYNDIKQLRMNVISLLAKNQFANSIWGEGYLGYGNGLSNTATQVVLPQFNKSNTRVPDIPFTEREMNERVLRRLRSGKPQQLVPIRLEFDAERDKFKLRDTFLWDLDEDVLPLENFVKTLVEDSKFISDHHYYTVLTAINEQIKSYKRTPDKTMGELRVPIKIDVTINNSQLTDQFEWDILNAGEHDAEDFAVVMCDELNLPGEFATLIAHSIREQAQMFHKALHVIGYSFDGLLIHEDEIRTRLLPSLRVVTHDHKLGTVVDDFFSILRNPANVPDFTPSLVKLTQLEVERLDKEIERELRRKRRHVEFESTSLSNGPNRASNSRRGNAAPPRGVKVALPDLSDVPKTFRTPAPSSVLPGAVDLGVPDIYQYNELVVNRSTVKNPNFRRNVDRVRVYHDPGRLLIVRIKLR